MRYQAGLIGIVISSLSLASLARAQTNDDAKAWADLVAAQKDLGQRFGAWEKELIDLQQKLERSKNPKDKRPAAMLKSVLETAREADAQGHGAKLTQLFASASPANLPDLKQLKEQSESWASRLDRVRRGLAEEALDRSDRIAFERHHKLVRSLAIYQRKLRDTPNDPAFLKTQTEINELAGLLAEQLRAFGKGSGKLGAHLQRADAHLQEAIDLQTKCVNHIRAKEAKLARECQDGALQAIDQCAAENEEILYTLRIAEHLFAMQSLARRFEAARKQGDTWSDAFTVISKAMAVNLDKKVTPEIQADCNQLYDQVRVCGLEVKRMSEFVESERTSSMLNDVLAGTLKDLREVARRLQLTDVGPDTQAFARRAMKSLEAGRNFAEGASRLLATLEPGQLARPLTNDVSTMASALDKLIAEQRTIEQRLVQRHDARLRQVLEVLLTPKDKK